MECLHVKEEKLIPQSSYADVSFLLLQTYMSILEAKNLMPVGRGKSKAYPQTSGICYMECTQKEKVPYSPKGSSRTRYFCSGLANPRIEALAFYFLGCKQNSHEACAKKEKRLSLSHNKILVYLHVTYLCSDAPSL